jgi:hypothetical protein
MRLIFLATKKTVKLSLTATFMLNISSGEATSYQHRKGRKGRKGCPKTGFHG